PTIRVGAVRDAAFGAWRYATRPEAGYACFLADDGAGGASGALVLRVLDWRGLRCLFVMDLLVAPEAPSAGRALLREAEGRARATGARLLSALLPPSGPTRSALLRFGFVRVPEPLHPQLVRFSVRGLGRFAGCEELVDRRAWWLSWADTDIV